MLRSVEAAAPRLSVELVSAPVHDTTELESAITAQGREPGGALLVLPDVFTSTHRELIIRLGVSSVRACLFQMQALPTKLKRHSRERFSKGLLRSW
jgi:hypothetical protein